MSTNLPEIKITPEVKKLLKIKGKVVMFPMADIKIDFFVRLNSDQARIETFAEYLVESGEHLPPIIITEVSNGLVDGRTRYDAYAFLGITEIPVVFCEEASRQKLLEAAVKANASALESLPPTKEDLCHTIELMIREGASQPIILKIFTPLIGRKVSAKLYTDARKKIKARKIAQAKLAVAEETMTVRNAAEHYDVPLGDLKKALGSSRQRKQTEEVKIRKQAMTSSKNAFNRGLSTRFTLLMKEFDKEDSLLTVEEVDELVRHERKLVANIVEMSDRHRQRWQAKRP